MLKRTSNLNGVLSRWRKIVIHLLCVVVCLSSCRLEEENTTKWRIGNDRRVCLLKNRSRSGVVGQGSLDHHVGRGGKFPILTNGSGISIAPMIDRSAACAAAGCSVEQEGCESILQARKLYNVKADVLDEEDEEEAEVENFQDVEAEAEREELKRL
ncbi:hypothetical protein T06_10835 [Trichinella sp. T6]|nr:hypothetical protein T06_10835 [Trichinella sp. T6]